MKTLFSRQVFFLRRWFADQKVTKFTVSLWFKRKGQTSKLAGLVSNGDCLETPGFQTSVKNGGVFAGITTDTEVVTSEEAVSKNSNSDNYLYRIIPRLNSIYLGPVTVYDAQTIDNNYVATVNQCK